MQVGLRVGVRTRGCNGLSYVLEYAKEKGKFDEEVSQDGRPIYMQWFICLIGTHMCRPFLATLYIHVPAMLSNPIYTCIGHA